jgi:hypothetical protein
MVDDPCRFLFSWRIGCPSDDEKRHPAPQWRPIFPNVRLAYGSEMVRLALNSPRPEQAQISPTWYPRSEQSRHSEAVPLQTDTWQPCGTGRGCSLHPLSLSPKPIGRLQASDTRACARGFQIHDVPYTQLVSMHTAPLSIKHEPGNAN